MQQLSACWNHTQIKSPLTAANCSHAASGQDWERGECLSWHCLHRRFGFVDNAKECRIPTSHSQTHDVVHVTGESSALSEDYTDRLFVALINLLLTEFLQCNRLSGCNQEKPSLHSHLSLGWWLMFWTSGPLIVPRRGWGVRVRGG